MQSTQKAGEGSSSARRTPLRQDLDHPAYHTRARLKGYNCAVNIFTAVSPVDAGRLLRRLLDGYTVEQHRQLARQHAEAAGQMKDDWNRLADDAAQQTLGRPFRFEDYQISGIAREEFTPAMKEKLRFAAHAGTAHTKAARAHWAAAGARKFPL